MFTTLIQGIIDFFAALAEWLILLLPTSPFAHIENVLLENNYLSTLNWLVPFGPFVAILQVYLVAVGTWYIYKILLRWIKLIK
jgi:hypothetical protein